MQSFPPYKIFPLGDSALTIDFGNVIDPIINDEVISIFDYLSSNKIAGMIEAVPAYSSLTIYYDFAGIKNNIKNITVFEWMKQQIEEALKSGIVSARVGRQVIRIPVCYHPEFALDSEKIAAEKSLSVDEIINIHTSGRYRVYMLGFLPGFAYMGQVDERIRFERKPEPENIKAGSVGIAGRQTGIYPFDSPGGWQIIGRTPLKIFNRQNSIPTLFHAGDTVEFYSITKDEFEDIKSRHS
jgi:inhibitor of KinA